MAGPGGQMHKGWRRHMRWAREQSWRYLPSSPAWTSIPIEGDGMNLRASASLFAPSTEFTGWKRGLILPDSQQTAGPVDVLGWPELTRFLLDAALQRDLDPASACCQDLYSYTIDFFTPPDPRRYSGPKVETLEVRTTSAGLALRLWLRAWKEESNDDLSEELFDYTGLTPGPFRLRDAAISLGGTSALDVEQFAVTVDNAPALGPNEAGRPAFIIAGPRSVRLDLVKLHSSDVLNAAVREGTPLSFSAAFAHPAGHELALELPVLYAAENAESAPPRTLARSHAVLQATADESGCDLVYEVTLAGATTTTTAF